MRYSPYWHPGCARWRLPGPTRQCPRSFFRLAGRVIENRRYCHNRCSPVGGALLMALSTRRPGHASGLDGELVAMIGSRDARYAETRKETQILSCLFAGNTSAINYSLRTTQMLDMAESGGGRLRPNRHLSFTATNRQGLAQKWRCNRSRFVIMTAPKSPSISYITTSKYSLRHRAFGRHLDTSSRMQFTMDYADTVASFALKC